MDTSMYRPRPVSAARRWGTALVTALFTAVNGLFPHAAEANFWAERKKAAQQMHAAPDEGLAYGGGPSRLTPDQQRLFAQLPRAGQMSMLGAPVADAAGGLSMAAKDASALPPLDSSSLASGSSWLSTLILPFGSLREIHLSPRNDAPLIIHIQDAHGIEEAQRNIAGLIQSLQENRGVNLVGVEGASGGFPLVEPLRGLARPEVVKDTAEAFLADGTLGGAEYAALASPRAPVLWGLEDAADYQANVQAVKEGLRGQKKIDAALKALAEEARALKAKIYSPELKQFDDRLAAYHAQSESLGDHVRYLMAAPVAKGGSWRNLSILVEALDSEAALDFRKVEQERLRLVERLAKTLPRRALDELVQKSLQHRLGQVPYGKYHAYLRDLCRAHGVVLSDLPQLKGYVDYVLLADDINREGLLKELEARERAVEAKLARTPEQARLAAAARRLGLAEKLAAHQMSPADWAAYSQDRAQILALPAELKALAGEQPGEALPEALIAPFENFCRLALRRNEHFVAGLLDRMKADKVNAAVLVAGGFHSDDLVKRFLKEGASVVLVTPKITEIPKDLNYLDVFSRDPLPLEKMFRGEVISLKHALPLGAKTADENTLRLGATEKAVEIFKQQEEGRLDAKAEQASLQAASPTGVTATVETNDGVASLELSFPTGAEARVVAAEENGLGAAAEAADIKLSQAERAQVGDAVVLYDQSTSLSAKARVLMPQILAAARQSRALAAKAAPAAASATDVALNASLFALPALVGLSQEAIDQVNRQNLPDEAFLLGWLASVGAKNPLNGAPEQLVLELAPPGLPSISDAPPTARFMSGPSAPVSAAPSRLVTLPGKVPVHVLYRESYPPSNVTVTTAEIHASLTYLGSLLKYLAEKKPQFLLAQAQQFSPAGGVDFKRETIQSISIDYIASGRHKAAYKFTIVMSNGVSLDVMAGLKTEAGSTLPLFEPGELAALEVLQGTPYVPRLGGVLYVEKKGDTFGISTTLAPPKREFTTVVFDELIKGRPIGLVHDFRKSEPPDWLAEACLLLLVRIYLTLNPDISKPGTGPDDIHPFNIVQEAGSGRVVMVDLGRQMDFNSLSQYLIGPVLYYSGQKDGSALQSLYREFPEIDWDNVLLDTVREAVKLKHTMDPEDPGEMSQPFKFHRREINWAARRVARFLVNTGRFRVRPSGQLERVEGAPRLVQAPAAAEAGAQKADLEQAEASLARRLEPPMAVPARPSASVLSSADVESVLQDGVLVGEPALISSEQNTSDVYRVTLEKDGKRVTGAFKRHNTSYGREHEVATLRVNKLLAGPDLKVKGSDTPVKWPEVPPVVIRRLSGRFGGEIGSANLFVEGREGSPDYYKSVAARRLGGFDFFTGNGDRAENANFIEQADGAIRPFDNGNAFSSSVGMSGFKVRHVPLPEDMGILAAMDEQAFRAAVSGLVTEGRVKAALARRSVQLAFSGMESLLEGLPMDLEILEASDVEELAALPSDKERAARAREFLMRAARSQVPRPAADLSVGAIFEGAAALDDLKEMLTPGGPAFQTVSVAGDADQVAAQIRQALAGLPEDRWVALSVRSSLDNGVVHHISVVDRVDALQDRVSQIAAGKADISDHEFVFHVVEDAARRQVHLHSISYGTRERRTLELAGKGKMAQPFRNVWAALTQNYAGWTISAIPTDDAVEVAVETAADGRKRFPLLSPFHMKRATVEERQSVLERYQPVAAPFHSRVVIGRVPTMDELAAEGFFDGYTVPAPRSALAHAAGTGLLAIVLYAISSPLQAVLGLAKAGASTLTAVPGAPHVETGLILPQLSVAAAVILTALAGWMWIRYARRPRAAAGPAAGFSRRQLLVGVGAAAGTALLSGKARAGLELTAAGKEVPAEELTKKFMDKSALQPGGVLTAKLLADANTAADVAMVLQAVGEILAAQTGWLRNVRTVLVSSEATAGAMSLPGGVVLLNRDHLMANPHQAFLSLAHEGTHQNNRVDSPQLPLGEEEALALEAGVEAMRLKTFPRAAINQQLWFAHRTRDGGIPHKDASQDAALRDRVFAPYFRAVGALMRAAGFKAKKGPAQGAPQADDPFEYVSSRAVKGGLEVTFHMGGREYVVSPKGKVRRMVLPNGRRSVLARTGRFIGVLGAAALTFIQLPSLLGLAEAKADPLTALPAEPHVEIILTLPQLSVAVALAAVAFAVWMAVRARRSQRAMAAALLEAELRREQPAAPKGLSPELEQKAATALARIYLIKDSLPVNDQAVRRQAELFLANEGDRLRILRKLDDLRPINLGTSVKVDLPSLKAAQAWLAARPGYAEQSRKFDAVVDVFENGEATEFIDKDERGQTRRRTLRVFPAPLATTYSSALFRGRLEGRNVIVKKPLPGMEGVLDNEAHWLSVIERNPDTRRLYPVDVLAYDAEHHTLVMEEVVGQSLDILLKRREPLPRLEAFRIGMGLLEGLANMPKGLVHQDVKPGNAILAADGRVVLIDFGIAAMEDLETPVTEVRGTYLPPEVFRVSAFTINPQTDVYAAALTIFRLVSGQELKRTSLGMVEDQRPRLPALGLPADVEAVLAKALSDDTQVRYATPAAFMEALGDALQKEGLLVPLREPRGEEPSGLRTGARKTNLSVAAALPTLAPLWDWASHNPGTAALVAAIVFIPLAVLLGNLRARRAAERRAAQTLSRIFTYMNPELAKGGEAEEERVKGILNKASLDEIAASLSFMKADDKEALVRLLSPFELRSAQQFMEKAGFAGAAGQLAALYGQATAGVLFENGNLVVRNELLGEGGFFNVYKGYLDGRPVAVKLARKEVKRSGPDGERGRKPLPPDDIDRLLENEYKQGQALKNHLKDTPLAAKLFALEDLALGFHNGRKYLVTELAGGVTLRELANENGGSLPLQTVLKFVGKILRGLEALPPGTVHRDIKPENIKYDASVPEEDSFKILDLGVATDPESHAAQGNSSAGTRGFMSPETIEDLEVRRASPPTVAAHQDLYATAATMFELLTGMDARDLMEMDMWVIAGDSLNEREAVLEGFNIPAPIAKVMARAYAKNPAERYQTARDMREALERAARDMRNTPVSAPSQPGGITKGLLLTAPAWVGRNSLLSWIWDNVAAPGLEEGAFRIIMPLGLAGFFPGVAGYAHLAFNALFIVLHVVKHRDSLRGAGDKSLRRVLEIILVPTLISLASSVVMLPAIGNLDVYGWMSSETQTELFLQMWAVHAFGNALVQPLLKFLGFDAEKASLATAAAAPSSRRRAPTSGQLLTAVNPQDAALPAKALKREAVKELPQVDFLDTFAEPEVLRFHHMLLDMAPASYGKAFKEYRSKLKSSAVGQESLAQAVGRAAAEIHAFWKTEAALPLTGLRIPEVVAGTRFGDYVVTDDAALGEGGFGGVYMAKKAGPDGRPMGPDLVIKTLPSSWEGRPLNLVLIALDSYRQEARMLRRLDTYYGDDSPAPRLYVSGEDFPYLVMGFEQGEVLKDMNLGDAQGALAAVTRLHEAGIVHKDIKPANFIRTARGIKILDFGGAAALRSLRPEDRRYQSGDYLHTPSYKAPEVDLQPGRVADFSSDAYSMAKMMRTLLPDAVVRRPDLWPILRAALMNAPEDRPSVADISAVFRGASPVWDGQLLPYEPAMVASHPNEAENPEQLRLWVLHSGQFPAVLPSHPEIQNLPRYIADDIELIKSGHMSVAAFQVKMKSLLRGADLATGEAMDALLNEMWYFLPTDWSDAADYEELLAAYPRSPDHPEKEDILSVLQGLKDKMVAPDDIRELLDAVPGLYDKILLVEAKADADRTAERQAGLGKGVLLPAPNWFARGPARLWAWENVIAPFLEEGFFRMVVPLGLGLLFPDTAGTWLVVSNAAFAVLHLLNDKSEPKTGWAAVRNVGRLMGLPLLISIASSAVMLPFLADFPLLSHIPLASLGAVFLQVWLIHVLGNALVQPFLNLLGVDVAKASLSGRRGLAAPLSKEERVFKLAVILAEYRANPEAGERLARVLLSDGREEGALSRTPVTMRRLTEFLAWDAEGAARAWASLRGLLAKDMPQPLMERLDGVAAGFTAPDAEGRRALEGIREAEIRRVAAMALPRPFQELSDKDLYKRYGQGLKAMAGKSRDNSVEAAALREDVALKDVQELHDLTEELALRVAAGQFPKNFKLPVVRERLQALKSILNLKRERLMTNSLAGQGWIASIFVSPPLELVLRKLGLQPFAASIASAAPWAPLVTALAVASVTSVMVGLHLWRYRNMGIRKTSWVLWAASQAVFTGLLLLPGGHGWQDAGMTMAGHVIVNGLILLLGREKRERVSLGIYDRLKPATVEDWLGEEARLEKVPASTPYARAREELDQRSLPVPGIPDSGLDPTVTSTEGADFTPSEQLAVAQDQEELAEITPLYSPAELLERALTSSRAGWATDTVIEVMASEEASPDPLVTFDKGPLTPAEIASVLAEQAANPSWEAGFSFQGGHSRVSIVTRPDGTLVARKTLLNPNDPFQVHYLRTDAMRLKELNEGLWRHNPSALRRIAHFKGYDEERAGLDGQEEGPALDMEFLPGLDLNGWTKHEGHFPLEEGLDVLEEIAEALSAVHGENVVHGDVKGSNVLYDRAGKRVVLVDFGLSGHVGDPGGVFTPAYASPEARNGAALDPRSDLYSLGVTALRILNGSIWPEGDKPLLASGILSWLDNGGYEKRQASVDRWADMPAPVRAVLKKLLAPRAEDRYQTAKELLADLRAARRPSRPPSSPPRTFVALSKPIWMSIVTFLFAGAVTARLGAQELAAAPKEGLSHGWAGAAVALVVAGLGILGLRWAVRWRRRSREEPLARLYPMPAVRPPTPESKLTLTPSGAIVLGTTDRVALGPLTGPERRFQLKDKEGLTLILGQEMNVRLPVVRRGNSLMFMIPNRDAVTTGTNATVGRNESNDVHLPQGYVLHAAVASGRHLSVSLDASRDELTVTDLGSKNGTAVEAHTTALSASSEEAAKTLASTQMEENARALLRFEEALAAVGRDPKDMYALAEAIDLGTPLAAITSPLDKKVKLDLEPKVRALKNRLRSLPFGDDRQHEFDFYVEKLKWITPGAGEGHWLLVDPEHLDAMPSGAFISKIEALRAARDRYVLNTAIPDANVWPLLPYLRALGGGSQAKDEGQKLAEDLVFARDIIDYFQSLPDDLSRRNIASLSSTDVATVKHWYQRVADQATDNDIVSRLTSLGYEVPANAGGIWALAIRTYLRKQVDLDMRNRKLGKLTREDAEKAFEDYAKQSLKTTEQASGAEAEAMRRPSQLPAAAPSRPGGRGGSRGMGVMLPVILAAAAPFLWAGARAMRSAGPAFSGISALGFILIAAGTGVLAAALMAFARWYGVVSAERDARQDLLAQAYTSILGWKVNPGSERWQFELVERLAKLATEEKAEEALAPLSNEELAALGDLLADHEQTQHLVEETRKVSRIIGALMARRAASQGRSGLPPVLGIALAATALPRPAKAAAPVQEPLMVNVYDRTAWLADRKALEVLRTANAYVEAYNALQNLLSFPGLTPALRPSAEEESLRGQEKALAAMLKEQGMFDGGDGNKSPEELIWSVLPAFLGERGILMWRVASTTAPTARAEARWRMEAGLSEIKEIRALDPSLGEVGASRELRLDALRYGDALDRNPHIVHGHVIIPARAEEAMADEMDRALMVDGAGQAPSSSALDASRRKFAGRHAQAASDLKSWAGRVMRFRMVEGLKKPVPAVASGEAITARENENSGRSYLDATLAMLRGLPAQDRLPLLYKVTRDYQSTAVRLPFARQAEHVLLDFLISYIVDNAGSLDMELDGETVSQKRRAAAGHLLDLTPEQLAGAVAELQEGLARMPDFQLPSNVVEESLYEAPYVSLPVDWTVPAAAAGVVAVVLPVGWIVARRMTLQAARLRRLQDSLRPDVPAASLRATAKALLKGPGAAQDRLQESNPGQPLLSRAELQRIKNEALAAAEKDVDRSPLFGGPARLFGRWTARFRRNAKTADQAPESPRPADVAPPLAWQMRLGKSSRVAQFSPSVHGVLSFSPDRAARLAALQSALDVMRMRPARTLEEGDQTVSFGRYVVSYGFSVDKEGRRVFTVYAVRERNETPVPPAKSDILRDEAKLAELFRFVQEGLPLALTPTPLRTVSAAMDATAKDSTNAGTNGAEDAGAKGSTDTTPKTATPVSPAVAAPAVSVTPLKPGQLQPVSMAWRGSPYAFRFSTSLEEDLQEPSDAQDRLEALSAKLSNLAPINVGQLGKNMVLPRPFSVDGTDYEGVSVLVFSHYTLFVAPSVDKDVQEFLLLAMLNSTEITGSENRRRDMAQELVEKAVFLEDAKAESLAEKIWGKEAVLTHSFTSKILSVLSVVLAVLVRSALGHAAGAEEVLLDPSFWSPDMLISAALVLAAFLPVAVHVVVGRSASRSWRRGFQGRSRAAAPAPAGAAPATDDGLEKALAEMSPAGRSLAEALFRADPLPFDTLDPRNTFVAPADRGGAVKALSAALKSPAGANAAAVRIAVTPAAALTATGLPKDGVFMFLADGFGGLQGTREWETFLSLLAGLSRLDPEDRPAVVITDTDKTSAQALLAHPAVAPFRAQIVIAQAKTRGAQVDVRRTVDAAGPSLAGRRVQPVALDDKALYADGDNVLPPLALRDLVKRIGDELRKMVFAAIQA